MSDLTDIYTATHLGNIKGQLEDISERSDRFLELFKLLITSQEKTATHLESLLGVVEELLAQVKKE